MNDTFLILSLIFLPILIGWMIWHERKLKKQQEAAKQKEIERQQWQQELAAKAEAIREKKRQEMAQRIARCSTLQGYYQENEACRQLIAAHTNHYTRQAARQRLSQDDRLSQIIWESAEIMYESKNIKTVHSRMALIRTKSVALGYCPIEEHDMRVLITHAYIKQMNILFEKAATYKTQSARQKAWGKMADLAQSAMNDKGVYREAFQEFIEYMEKIAPHNRTARKADGSTTV
ncbi:hypothetical protein [Bergeriella denitrificans]|uniref:Uncharacterized protein n=1 Tax=Bergeriella denitrificans TaxID=494 RepID=A0A378UG86_BERDE|nr:hypothetical protein [Bergeriella denitrificans]STZ76317.1 Uncharacterised protein [Bergeriella denitrificans]